MLNAIFGRPGNGKGYEGTVHHIIPALKSGRKVVTNVPLDFDRLRLLGIESPETLIRRIEDSPLGPAFHDWRHLSFNPCPDAKTPAELMQQDWHEPGTGRGALIVIDEAQLPFRSGRKMDPNHNAWFEMHRHGGYDLIIMTQDERNLDRSILALVQFKYVVVKNLALGPLGAGRYTCTVYDGMKGPKIKLFNRAYDKSMFGVWKSHTVSSEAVKEVSEVAHVGSTGHVLVLVVSCLFIVLGIIAGYSWLMKPRGQSSAELAVASSKANSVASAPTLPAAPSLSPAPPPTVPTGPSSTTFAAPPLARGPLPSIEPQNFNLKQDPKNGRGLEDLRKCLIALDVQASETKHVRTIHCQTIDGTMLEFSDTELRLMGFDMVAYDPEEHDTVWRNRRTGQQIWAAGRGRFDPPLPQRDPVDPGHLAETVAPYDVVKSRGSNGGGRFQPSGFTSPPVDPSAASRLPMMQTTPTAPAAPVAAPVPAPAAPSLPSLPDKGRAAQAAPASAGCFSTAPGGC